MDIGNKIRELRMAKNMTQKDLADMLFVTPQAVSRWESSSAEPSLEVVNKIADHFGVSVDYMVGKPEKKPETTVGTPEQHKVETRPVLAVCESCNTPLYDSQDIVRHSHRTGRGGSSKRVICRSCEEKQKKAWLEYHRQKGLKLRLFSFIFSGLIAAVLLTISLIVTIPTKDAQLITVSIVVSLLSYTFASCLFLKNNFVGDMVGEIFSWGFVKFPGLIFSLDLDGLIWLLTVKLLFWIIGIILAGTFLLVGVAIGLVVSVFVYPFALIKNYKHPELINE